MAQWTSARTRRDFTCATVWRVANVPTWREQGYDIVVKNWRALVGPKNMTAAQIAYREESMRRMSESEEWKKKLEANFWRAVI